MKKTLMTLGLMAMAAVAGFATVQAHAPSPSCFPCVSDEPIGQIPPPAR